MTIRKALELLRDEGLVDARQGFGWFAAVDPLRQSLGRLGTIEGQLADSGVRSERRDPRLRFVAAPAAVRQVLGAATVLEVRRLNLADGEPFARVTVWCPEDLGAQLSRREVERAPVLRAARVPLGGRRRRSGPRWSTSATPRCSRSGRLAGAAVRARHLRPRGPPGAAVRARVPRPPHRVRGRPPAGRAKHRPQRAPPGGLATASSSYLEDVAAEREDPRAPVGPGTMATGFSTSRPVSSSRGRRRRLVDGEGDEVPLQ